MGELINFRRVKKRNERVKLAKAAETSRARFSRTKAEKTRDKQQAKQTSDHLDSHRIDDESPS